MNSFDTFPILSVCYRTEERKTSVTFVDSATSQTGDVATQTDEDVTTTQHIGLTWMIHQYLVHVIDITRGNLIDKLVTKGVLSSAEKEQIKKLKKTDAKVDRLATTMWDKSAAEYEHFLAALSEAGQPSVADVVCQALQTAGLTGQNPLQHLSLIHI